MFLGLPFNIASYALLIHIVARITGYKPGKLIGFLGDVHIYNNAIDATKEVLTREPFELPTVWINPELRTLEDFENSSVDDYKLIGYNHHKQIKVEMAV